MSLIAHKYTPAEMSEAELDATFAAREHTVEYLLKSLRDQNHSGTLSSFVITGPRGAGKSTIIQMTVLRMKRDSELSRAWIPVLFPEEQFGIVSLRDFLAEILRELSEDGRPEAREWLEKVSVELNDDQSLQLAMTGLREITQKAGKRLVVFVENLNLMLDGCLNDQMKGTLRRLLMTDPFMMLIGSSVHVFDSLKKYDEAFFNYFGRVPLDRLDVEQVFELLFRRAEFDKNERFLREFKEQRPKIRAIVHLSGGNPRLILMLYELLSQKQVTTIVQCLRCLVDELTPLLKDEMENLSPQQRKIIHALMEKGGTAQPADLAEPTRLPLNAITTQLRRLKEAQIVEVLGGGKGRAAYYTVPDKLFSIWYQMRYLTRNRRRIELFVEVLRVWFEAEERFSVLQSLEKSEGDAVHESALTSEYFAASLSGTPYAPQARDCVIRQWLKSGNLNEASSAYAELFESGSESEVLTRLRLGLWCVEHDNSPSAMEVYNLIISDAKHSEVERALALLCRGFSMDVAGNHQQALADFSTVIDMEVLPEKQLRTALIARGNSKSELNDYQGAVVDFTTVIEAQAAQKDQVGAALLGRGIARMGLGDYQRACADFTKVIGTEKIPALDLIKALSKRARSREKIGDVLGALSDYTAIIDMGDVPREQIARALFGRGEVKRTLGDDDGVIEDYEILINMDGTPKRVLAGAFFVRGYTYFIQARRAEAVADWERYFDLNCGPEFDIADPVAKMFRFYWERQSVAQANNALGYFLRHIQVKPADQQVALLAGFIATLAHEGVPMSWVYATVRLLETQPEEIKQALGFIGPVCSILEGGDKCLLDPLPPEQRELALQVLERFEKKDKL